MKNWETLEADVTKLVGVHYTPCNGTRTIRGVVLHHNAGNLSVDGCWSVWQTREASAHYQVQSDGLIGQLVWDNDIAWHAGNANGYTIGIEHADISTNPWLISDACLDNGAHLVAAICKYYKLGRPTYGKNVWFHSDFMSTSCPASIAGSQKDEYLSRAGAWYDAMTGNGNNPTTTTEEDDMPSANEVAQAVWAYCAPDKDGKPNNTQPMGNPYEQLKMNGGPCAILVEGSGTVRWINPVLGTITGFSSWDEWTTWCSINHIPSDTGHIRHISQKEYELLQAFLKRMRENKDIA